MTQPATPVAKVMSEPARPVSVVNSATIFVTLPVILSARVMTENVKTVINVSLVIYPATTVMTVMEPVTKPVRQDMVVVLPVRVVVLPATVVFHLPATLVILRVRLLTVLIVILVAIFARPLKIVQLVVGLTVKPALTDIHAQTEPVEVVIVQAGKTLAVLVMGLTHALIPATVVMEGVRAVLPVGMQEVVVQGSVTVVIVDRVVEVDNSIATVHIVQADKTHAPLVTEPILIALPHVGVHLIIIVRVVILVVTRAAMVV